MDSLARAILTKHEYAFIFRPVTYFFLYGLGLWLVGTVALRLGGEHLLNPSQPTVIALLFAVSFPLMAWVARRLCTGRSLSQDKWPRATIFLCLPTLLLDPFSSTFFALVFPNMRSEAAGVFGGWMLWCCGGALVGAIVRK
jgi:hypothetical protein